MERGLVTPSVATLLPDLRRTLVCGSETSSRRPHETKRLIRAKNERTVYRVPSRVRGGAHLGGRPEGNVELVWSRIPPGGGSGEELLRHGSETECVYVLEGSTIEVVVGEDRHTLDEGDCLTIPGELPHGCFNRTGRPGRAALGHLARRLLTSRRVDVVASSSTRRADRSPVARW